MTVTRWYTNATDGNVFAHPDGPFVLWSDYERLEAAMLKARDYIMTDGDSMAYVYMIVSDALAPSLPDSQGDDR